MTRTPRHLLHWTIAAGLLAGALDLFYATGFWALKGVPAQRILQSIAAGLIGKGAFAGGAASAALGLALHLVMATAMAAAYAMAAMAWPRLRDRAWLHGPLYGLLLYAVMNAVVLPLSAVPGKPVTDPVWIACSIVVHMVLVGLPIAWCVQRAFGRVAARASRRVHPRTTS